MRGRPWTGSRRESAECAPRPAGRGNSIPARLSRHTPATVFAANRPVTIAPSPEPTPPHTHHHLPSTRAAVRGVAIFEAAKGLLVLVVGFDLLRPFHRDLQFDAEEMVRHLHMNPASRFPHIFVEATSRFEGMSLTPLALGAAAYALIRFVEAYGLWRQRAWAEWFAAAAGAIYIPFEIRHLLFHHHRVLTALILAANVVIVGVMVRALRRRAAPA
jgi:uncharacterized membrane protein (DUF2068 family)